MDTSWYCYVAFRVGIDLLVIGAHGYLEMVVMLISLGLDKYLLQKLFGFSRKCKWYSPDMDLGGDCSYMSLGWRLGYLDEHSHSPLLVYLAVCYLRGIAHCFSQLHYIYTYLSWIWILRYGTWVSSGGFIWEMVKHWLSPFAYVVMLVDFGRWFYIGYIPWFRNGYSLS